MIEESKLVNGGCYFFAVFYDREGKIPIIKTYIFIGKNLCSDRDESRGDEWFFQDPESYFEHGIFTRLLENVESDVLVGGKNILIDIYDMEGLVKFLQMS